MKINLLYFFLLIVIFSCQKNDISSEKDAVRATMLKHLDAVSTRNLEALSSTLSPDNDMMLILPQSEIRTTKDEFIDFHRRWFEDESWTFDTKIISVEAGTKLGMAIVEVIYKEPARNGKPYYNRMVVSYVLEKKSGKWCVIKDHASSIEKGEG